MTATRRRFLLAIAYAAPLLAALFAHQWWIAALACGVAARTGPPVARWPLYGVSAAFAMTAFVSQPFAEGQALLSNLVFPFALVLVSSMAPPRAGGPLWPASIATASTLLVVGGAAHDNALTGEVAAALCLVAGQWRR